MLSETTRNNSILPEESTKILMYLISFFFN